MKSGTIDPALFLALALLAAGSVQAAPPPFSIHDTDGDGYVSREEFDRFRAERQAQRAAEGGQLRRAPSLMTFDQIDADGDGRISESEMLLSLQQRRGQARGGSARE